MSRQHDLHLISRRSAIAGVSMTAAGLAAMATAPGNAQSPGNTQSPSPSAAGADAVKVDAKQGRLNQSVCKWCYPRMSLEQLAKEVAALGMVGIDLLDPVDFPVLKKHGLVCTMVQSHPLDKGLCDPQFHEMCLQRMDTAIRATAEEGWRNVICFSGNARGIDRESGLKNCADALSKILPLAEEKGVTLVMELLNSKVDHPDYMCDNSPWGIELVKRVGSDRFKLLYDIYHMQIMEGDIIRTIRENHQHFGHYHTAGNPGRHELDESQELLYRPIAQAIADTCFDGFFAHEFIPTRDPMESLSDAVRQCTV